MAIKLKGRATAGFTLVEILIVIVVIAILATIGIVSYSGVRQSATKAVVIDNLRQASSAVEITHLSKSSELPDNAELTEIPGLFSPSPGVVTKIYQQPKIKYNNLTAVQNAVLFQTICSSLSNENRPDASDLVYGEGRDQANNKVKYLWGPSLCNVYNKDRIQFNTSWGFAGGQLIIPVSKTNFTNFINNINNTDSYFPDATHVAKQYYQTTLDRFESQGGVFPITTFWDDWCQTGQAWCTAKEALPEVVATDNDSGYYCLEAYHENYPEMIFKLTSDSRSPEPGKC